MHTIKQSRYGEVYLAYLLYSLTKWIIVALGWCGIVAKMPGRTGWKAEIRVVSPTHRLWQTPLILLMLNMSLLCKWWEWEVMAPADWLWWCQKQAQMSTCTCSEVFWLDDCIIKSENLWRLPTVKCEKSQMIILSDRTSILSPKLKQYNKNILNVVFLFGMNRTIRFITALNHGNK